MYPILYENSETQFITNGIGRLSDCSECTVHEVRNGEYELTMMYPVNGKYFREIQEWRIIGATHDNSGDIQPFDIYKISRPSHGYIEVHAQHISYRTSKIILIPSMAVGVTLQDFFDGWVNNSAIIGACPFTFYSDLLNEENLDQPNFASIRSYLYGTDTTGIIGCYGYNEGEYLLNKFNISFLVARGQDNGKKFRTGKNVRLLTCDTDISDVITAVVPYWLGKDPVSGDSTYRDLADDGYIVEFSGATPHAQQLTKQLDLSSVFEQPPLPEELEAAAQEWMSRHNYNTVHRESYVIEVTDEIQKDINACNLCDLVTVEDEVNDYRVKLKITETTWNVIKNRYDSIVVGDRRPTITETFKKSNAIYIQQVSNNQEQISALAKKKAQVEQTITPTTTTGATKIGSVDGTDLYAPPSGGASDKKAGGANNQYGVFEDYNAQDQKILVVNKDGIKVAHEASTAVQVGSATYNQTTIKKYIKSEDEYVAPGSNYLSGNTFRKILNGHNIIPVSMLSKYGPDTRSGAVSGDTREMVEMYFGCYATAINGTTPKTAYAPVKISSYADYKATPNELQNQKVEIKIGTDDYECETTYHNKHKMDGLLMFNANLIYVTDDDYYYPGMLMGVGNGYRALWFVSDTGSGIPALSTALCDADGVVPAGATVRHVNLT